jgi:predicted transcriptional regulator
MIRLPDNDELSTEQWLAVYKQLGFRTQTEAAEALGVDQGYISKLNNGRKFVQPGTSLFKLLHALLCEQSLLRPLQRLEGRDDGPV